MAPRYSPRLWIVLAGLFASTLFAPAAGYAQIPVGPFLETFTVVNPCTGEPVLVESNTRMDVYPRAMASGGVHMTSRLLQHGKGVTVPPTPPASYQFAHEELEELNWQSFPDGTLETTFIINSLLIRKGNDTSVLVPPATKDDFMARSRFHVTFNANGVITAFVSRDGVSCPMEEP